ncbi:LRR receptor-like serine/threonine-protein kinase RCH1 [Panicum miliaceum]|uniref:non-specific serine/threonine protein kinase n=1 Tax=Panicum miliaceum TaxID=4540 RepID=A0A3L6PW03_PANMI|nr:LRR receptor-like serine/threonine-protein kinase RCH1 [Panicum miliaceum]
MRRRHLLLPLPLLLLHLLAASSPSAAAAGSSEVAFLTSWLNTTAARPPDWSPVAASPCNWSHISCDGAGAGGGVTSVFFQSEHLAVTVPAGLCAALPGLVSFVVSDANLTGGVPDDLWRCRRLAWQRAHRPNPPSLGNATAMETLALNSNQLSGPIPPELAGLAPTLKNLHLFDNRLSGELPPSLGELRLLESLRAGGNHDLAGPIPDSFFKLSNLVVLGLADTKISGPLPASLGQLQSLEMLSIYTTALSGAIPPEVGNCSNLTNIYLYENSLSGPLPPSLGALPQLQKLLLLQNALTGPIPESFGNLTSLVSLDLSINSISGTIPASLGRLPELQDLMLSDNNITGTIPPSLANATSLVQLQVDTNEISGLIPPELGRLSGLQVFFAWQNQLEGAIPATLASLANLQALDLSHNHLTGIIPPGLFLLRNLTKLLLLSNDLSGPLPPEVGKAASLVRLRLGGNRIAGSIPVSVSGMKSINFLDLGSNRLAGPVPAELGNCSQLQMLDLSNNSLSGQLPESLAAVHGLQELDVSHNRLTGAVPDAFGNLETLSRLVLCGNSLSGPIPPVLGQCRNLELLDLSDNNLTGNIPDELCGIDGLDIALNLSRNGLTGPIPAKISALSKLSVLDLSYNALDGSLAPLAGLDNLVTLNVSNNNFSGYLPDTKLFRQLSASSLAGNAGLCTKGGDVCFVSIDANGHPVMNTAEEAQRVHRLKLVTATVAMVLGMIGILRARRMGFSGGKSGGGGGGSDSESGGELSWPWQFTAFQKLSFSVEQVVRNLVDANIIGKGCSGVVYRVSLDTGEVIAVKKLWPASTHAAACKDDGTSGRVRDSFSAEVRTLGTIRHKNIVRFLGCCWNKTTRLLMYDYMANGSLGAVLHERRGGGGAQLEWDVRYRIVLGAAQGLAYLHHDCVPPIVHRDIKANNILIGLDFEAYIADFGLAKLVEDGDFGRSSNTVAGSYGYIAPEYGYMMKITEKSDVYSYGVVVLEVLTGKQPIDPTIPDGLHVVDWVRRRSRDRAGVLDPALQGRSTAEVEEMLQVMGVALLCVSLTPDDRPTMKDVAAMLKEIRLEREDVANVDVLLKGGSSPPSHHAAAAATAAKLASSSTSSTPPYRQGPSNSNSCSSSSFSAIYSSSNKDKSPFG